MTEQSESAQLLSQYAADLRYEDIPSQVREHTKRCILDSLGVTIAAGTLGLGHTQLVELIKEGGGNKESTILSFGGKVPAWMAAFANGAMARAVNYDDNHDESIAHPSGVTLSSVLAVAERVGNVSGKDLITAVTLGNDITCRMGLSICQRPKGVNPEEWFLSAVNGTFGATVACSKVLRLDADKTRDALGIALFEASGTAECFTATGAVSMMRGMVTGFTAKSAVLAALMAEKGITGVKESLNGKAGLYNVYFGGDYHRDSLTGQLGKRFVSGEIAQKPWPTCRYIQSYIDNVIQLVREHNISGEDIKQIRPHVAGFIKTRCEPLEHQRRPENFNHAGHALPYLLAVAATKKRIRLKDLITELDDPRSLEMAQKVEPVYDERFDVHNRIGPSMVEIELNNGNSFSKELRIAYGHPQNPLSFQHLTDKFRDCVSFSKNPVAPEKVEETITLINRLEEIDDISRMIRLLG
jgi:2-methylcitrate dehydratase PrpD